MRNPKGMKLLLTVVAVVAAIIMVNLGSVLGVVLGVGILIATSFFFIEKIFNLLEGGVGRLTGGTRGEIRREIQGVEEPPD